MRFNAFKFSFVVAATIAAVFVTQNSYANSSLYDYCSVENYVRMNTQQAGFYFTKQKTTILRANRPLEKNKNVTPAQAEQRILKAIGKARKKIDSITDERLARLIMNASVSVGVDFTQLTGMIHKETHFCRERLNTAGSGASGCTQFTTIALQELKDQFAAVGMNSKGKSKHTRSPEAEAVLKGFVKNYFSLQPDPKRINNFYAWINSSISNMQASFRGRGNFDIDILAGALLLKINLANAGGNYYKALVMYNGDNTRTGKGKNRGAYKYKYAAGAQANASQVSFVDDMVACQEAVLEANFDIDQTCDLFEEDPMDCTNGEESLLPPPLPQQWA